MRLLSVTSFILLRSRAASFFMSSSSSSSRGVTSVKLEAATSSSSSLSTTLHDNIILGVKFYDLGIPPAQLRADFTLIMGQCFNWRKLPDRSCWVGCLGSVPMAVMSSDLATYAAYLLPSDKDSESEIRTSLRTQMRAYFQIDHDLEALYASWAKSCTRMQVVTERLPGVRVVQQDPFECLISFICSSNNNIKRITQMLDKLKYKYGRYVCTVVREKGDGSSQDVHLHPWAVTVESPERVARITADMLSGTKASISSGGGRGEGSMSSPLSAVHLHSPAPPSSVNAPLVAMAQSASASTTRKRSRTPSAASPDTRRADDLVATPASTSASPSSSSAAAAAAAVAAFSEHHLFEFPSIESLAAATEAELRALGMGYRAKFILGTAQLLAAKPGGGDRWLQELRAMAADSESSRLQVQSALCECPGIGRKVADCVALFSLDQTASIPVDTHVWDICCRDYDPSLKDAKSLTPVIYERVGDVFRSRFESKAGWAHSVLFAAELGDFRRLLPEALQAEMKAFADESREHKAAKKADAAARRKSPSGAGAGATADDEAGADDDDDDDDEGKAPQKKKAKAKPKATAKVKAEVNASTTPKTPATKTQKESTTASSTGKAKGRTEG